MKPLLVFSFLLLAALPPTVQAQPPVGIRVGAGRSNPSIRYDPALMAGTTTESRTGLVLGVYTQFPVSKAWMIQPGVQFASKGYKEGYNGSAYATPIIDTYLELPVNFVYSSKPEGNGFQAGAGPVIGIVMEPEYQPDYFRKIDVGGSVLLGYKIPIGFSLQLHYTHGLINTVEGTSPFTHLKNRYLALTAGYLF